jgi:hypothetical protein
MIDQQGPEFHDPKLKASNNDATRLWTDESKNVLDLVDLGRHSIINNGIWFPCCYLT